MTRVYRGVIIPEYKEVATTLAYDHGTHWHRKYIEVEKHVLQAPGDPQFRLSFVAHSGSYERLSAIDNVEISAGYCPKSGELQPSHTVHTQFNYCVPHFALQCLLAITVVYPFMNLVKGVPSNRWKGQWLWKYFKEMLLTMVRGYHSWLRSKVNNVRFISAVGKPISREIVFVLKEGPGYGKALYDIPLSRYFHFAGASATCDFSQTDLCGYETPYRDSVVMWQRMSGSDLVAQLQYSLGMEEMGTQKMEMSFWWNFHHMLHWKLSFWQLPVQPMTKMLLKWWHFHSNVATDYDVLNI